VEFYNLRRQSVPKGGARKERSADAYSGLKIYWPTYHGKSVSWKVSRKFTFWGKMIETKVVCKTSYVFFVMFREIRISGRKFPIKVVPREISY